MAERIVFHVDVNSAFLSWTAAECLRQGETLDLREVPAVVGGDREARHGIVLAKSIAAKKFGIQTGEPLGTALRKCPSLRIAAPNYDLYMRESRRFLAALKDFSPLVEQYSIDEAWLDMTGTARLFGAPEQAAQKLRTHIFQELGVTVNVGISLNKMLAKMAGDFEKPNRVHTLFPSEIPEKLWPLPVRQLLFVGAATGRRLLAAGILTVGDLARSDRHLLRQLLHTPGETLWYAANGYDASPLCSEPPKPKSCSESVTTRKDMIGFSAADAVLLSLCEGVGEQLRRQNLAGTCITLFARSCEFEDRGRQMTLSQGENGTRALYLAARGLLRELWDEQTPLRKLGVQVGKLREEDSGQMNFFADPAREKQARLDDVVDEIRKKFGKTAVIRARLLAQRPSSEKPIAPCFREAVGASA